MALKPLSVSVPLYPLRLCVSSAGRLAPPPGDDSLFVTRNPLAIRRKKCIIWKANATIRTTIMANNRYLDAFMRQFPFEGLTYDDVTLVTQYADFLPDDASLETRLTSRQTMKIPFMSAAMDTSTMTGTLTRRV